MLYLRIFLDKTFRMACHIFLVIVAGLTVGATIATLLQCIPLVGAWDKTITATCTNTATFWYAWAVINVVTDVALLLLPVREVLRLQLPRREKYGLLALFSLGILSVTHVLWVFERY